jgi:hypothetical protein
MLSSIGPLSMRSSVMLRFAKKSGTAKSGNERRRTDVNAGPMLIKAYRIESRRHGSIHCQPVLMAYGFRLKLSSFIRDLRL